jgi:hypothetical protein
VIASPVTAGAAESTPDEIVIVLLSGLTTPSEDEVAVATEIVVPLTEMGAAPV